MRGGEGRDTRGGEKRYRIFATPTFCSSECATVHMKVRTKCFSYFICMHVQLRTVDHHRGTKTPLEKVGQLLK